MIYGELKWIFKKIVKYPQFQLRLTFKEILTYHQFQKEFFPQWRHYHAINETSRSQKCRNQNRANQDPRETDLKIKPLQYHPQKFFLINREHPVAAGTGPGRLLAVTRIERNNHEMNLFLYLCETNLQDHLRNLHQNEKFGGCESGANSLFR